MLILVIGITFTLIGYQTSMFDSTATNQFYTSGFQQTSTLLLVKLLYLQCSFRLHFPGSTVTGSSSFFPPSSQVENTDSRLSQQELLCAYFGATG